MDPDLRLGIDLGGTKIEGVVIRLCPADEGPQVLSRVRVPTAREQGYDHVLHAVAQVIDRARSDSGLGDMPPIGVGMPGGVTYGPGRTQASGGPLLVKNSNTTCLNGRPFRDDLMRLLGRPIAFANDANCFALAEAACGAARGLRVVFGVIMGTGVGGGVVLPGPAGPVIWDGAQGIAGEWGHVVLDPAAGPPCYCGRRGCIEQYLSGPAIESDYARRTPTSRPLREIAERAKGGGDEAATQTLENLCRTFGRALATVIDILDPDAIVLGGGVSNLEILYGRGIEEVGRWVFNDRLDTRIIRNQLGDSAGVIGAALL